MPETARYLYGIIKTNRTKSFGPNVCAVAHQEIACVVSHSPVQDYSSMLKEDLGRLLVKHQTTIEKIMEDHTIIPMKFGTCVSNDDEVTQVLKRSYPQFKDLLVSMDGKIELDVAVIWNDLKSVIKEIGEEDKEISGLKAEIGKKPPDKTFQDRIKVGMMIKDALDKRREKEQARIIDFLKGTTVDYQKHQVMDDTMILNCAFLLEKVKEPDFDSRLKELDQEYEQKVNFKCVGPLPPYSFATCRLEKVNIGKIDKARKLLGLGDRTSLNELKETYRNFVQTNHPDKHPEDSGLKDKFEEVTRAYKLLTGCCQAGDISFQDDKQKDFMVVEIIRP